MDTPRHYAHHRRAELGVPLAFAITAWATLVLWLRLMGVNFDSGTALNPDARHLFNLASAMVPKLDAALADGMSWWRIWFDTAVSPLNPRADGGFYVYGELPLTLNVLIGYAAGLRDYTDFILLGRILAALLHASAIVAVSLSAWVVGARPAAILLAGVLFAAAPTGFQIAGFAIVDNWLLSAWAWAGLGLLSMAHSRQSAALACTTGAAIAAAAACKLTGLGLGLPALAVVILRWRDDPADALRLGLIGLISIAVAFRLLSPMSFAGLWTLAPDYLGDLAELRTLAGQDQFPPNWQWLIEVSAARRLSDITLFGTGPVLAAAALAGLLVGGVKARLVLLALLAVPALHLALAYNPALRYGVTALPALAILGARSFERWPVVAAALGAAALLWVSPLVRLHLSEHSRIAASLWLLSQPGPTQIVVESYWDDPLPIRMPNVPERADITGASLMLEAAPSLEKVDRIVRLVSEADFIVSSSGRFAEVQPHLADRYPVAAAWFDGLASGKFCITPVWTRNPGYPLPFVTLDDSGVQEPWTVFDHPPVTIREKAACFDPEVLRSSLTAAIPGK